MSAKMGISTNYRLFQHTFHKNYSVVYRNGKPCCNFYKIKEYILNKIKGDDILNSVNDTFKSVNDTLNSVNDTCNSVNLREIIFGDTDIS